MTNKNEYLKEAILDANQMMGDFVNRLRYQGGIGNQLAPLIYNLGNENLLLLLETRIKNDVELALSSGIRGLRAGKSFEDLLEAMVGHMVNVGFKTFFEKLVVFMNELLLEVDNQVFDITGRPTYNLWRVTRGHGTFVMTNEGDFRVMEWERDHIDANGFYR